jgi:hypothetical protein
MYIGCKKFILNGQNVTKHVDSVHLYADGWLESGSFQVYVNFEGLPFAEKYDFTCLDAEGEIEISGHLDFWRLDTTFQGVKAELGTQRHKLTFWTIKSIWKDGLFVWFTWRLQRIIKTGR